MGVDDRIRVGLVGCGRISSRHINAIECNPELELRALCDVDKVAMGNVCTPVSVSRFHEFEDLATYDGVDLVVLCTPSGLHAAQTCKALESGKDVVVEKPMATRWADGLKMVNAVDETGRKLFVVKQNRFNPTVEKAKKLIEDGTLGKIFLVSSHVLWSRPQAYYDSATWRGTWEFDGGALMNQASHYVDLMPNGQLRQYTAIQEAKSVITAPSGGQKLLSQGYYCITGLAWSGRGSVRKVEVSVDGGRNWQGARLEGQVSSKMLTRFNFDWVWRGEPALLQSRVSDDTGYIQPQRAALVAERGTRSIYHNNAIQTWRVSPSGEVDNVQVG